MDSPEAAAAPVDLGRTFGALLLGSAMAFGLSGIVSTQCVVYYKQYPKDTTRTKCTVGVSWILDIAHTIFVIVAIYEYFITYFGEAARADWIPWSLALSVVTTALQTLLVHCFFAEKIYRSSQNNWLITAPIVVIAFIRVVCATITTANMIRLGRFSAFSDIFPRTMFTTGLTLSAVVDILITGWLCYYLREIRTRIGPRGTVMVRMVDSLTLYTLENAALPCFAAIASLICWLSMPHNLIFMGLHLVISKLYANSLLASLNMRNELRQIEGRMRYHLGTTTSFRKDQGPESALQIQNSRSMSTTDSRDPKHQEYMLSDLQPDPNAQGKGKRRVAKEPTTIIQFRPASSTYWNVIAQSGKPDSPNELAPEP
ncbi:hypothetical protein FA15DRAFT_671665 [Coprinopsis marcescibilis]|uniref:DUF6534 domain-containing protein n=1 Tax=Coprinopsis marcescibilis TaxID=230819 RepID=A0A5C3KQ97_COPMA|nr:hypothetical protein FA15DRAFT_671665 [Coprinopsis marcescibilis]